MIDSFSICRPEGLHNTKAKTKISASYVIACAGVNLAVAIWLGRNILGRPATSPLLLMRSKVVAAACELAGRPHPQMRLLDVYADNTFAIPIDHRRPRLIGCI